MALSNAEVRTYPRKRRAQVRIGLAVRAGKRLLEMIDAFAAFRRGVVGAATSPVGVGFRERRVDRARTRCASAFPGATFNALAGDRATDAVLAQVERQLGLQLRR